MMIEAMVRWTEMRIKPTDTNESRLKELLDGERQPSHIPEFYYDLSPYTFDMEDVASYNRSSDKKCTTARFKNGDNLVIHLSYITFQNLYCEATGRSIHSVLTEEELKDKELDGNDQQTITKKVEDNKDFDIDKI